MKKLTFILATIILSIAVAGCEIDTTVSVDGRNPPSFRVSGNGGIIFLRVADITDCNKSLQDCPVVWEIGPPGEFAIADLPLITYGRVPKGFHQTVPASDAPAPALVEGKIYSLWAPTYGANGGGVGFIIKDGESIKVR